MIYPVLYQMQIANRIYGEVFPREAFLQRVVNGGGRIAREYGLGAGLEQTARYADQCGADSAHLLIFDRDPAVQWDAKVYREQHSQGNRSISVWGM